jgi:hypothetical protein
MGAFKVIFAPRSCEDLRPSVRFIARQSDSDLAEKIGLTLIEKALEPGDFSGEGPNRY